MRRKVKIAKLHASYFPGGVGNLKDTLDTENVYKGMVLYATDAGLEGSYKGVEFFIYGANVVGCTFAKEEPKPAEAPSEPKKK